jgi:hypothetical protein
MSTQGREADARWHLKRAKELRVRNRELEAELRAQGREGEADLLRQRQELDARRHERCAADTRAFNSTKGDL